MGYVLILAGLLLVITGGRGTYKAFGAQLQSDFTGPGNFTYWIVAIGAVGSLGYVERLRTFSRLFMALLILSLLLSNRGFFAQFTAALKSGPVAPPANPDTAGASMPNTSTWQSNGQTGGTNPMNQGLFGQSPDGPLGDQSRFNNFMNSIVKGVTGGYSSP